MTGRVAHGRPFIFLFSGIVRQRYIPVHVPARFSADAGRPYHHRQAHFRGRLDRDVCGRLRSGNSPTSRGTAFAKTLATLGVIRTKAYGTLFGSCCPAHTSQLAGPLAGINAQPPAPASELKSIKPNTMPRQRTVALPPTDTTPSAKDHARSMRRLVDDPSQMWSFSGLCYRSATPNNAPDEIVQRRLE